MTLNPKTFSDLITFSRSTTGTRVNASGLIETIAANQPRFDFDPVSGQALGILIEEARTNVMTYSTDMSNGVWGASSEITKTANAAAGPTGSANMTLFTVSTTGNPTASRSFTTPGTSVAYSIFTRKGTASTATFLVQNNTTSTNFQGGTFNYDTGQITGSGWSVKAFPGGLYRLTFVQTTGISSGDSLVAYYGATGDSLTAGTSWYVSDAQVEAGSFATSYIPTTSAQVTRAADFASVSISSIPGYNAVEGTYVVEYIPNAIPPTSGNPQALFYARDSPLAGQDVISARLTNTQQINVVATAAGSTSIILSTTLPNILNVKDSIKLAVGYKSGNYGTCLSGGSVSDYAITGSPLPDVLYIGGNGSSQIANGTIKSLTYYPARLADADLQQVTTL